MLPQRWSTTVPATQLFPFDSQWSGYWHANDQDWIVGYSYIRRQTTTVKRSLHPLKFLVQIKSIGCLRFSNNNVLWCVHWRHHAHTLLTISCDVGGVISERKHWGHSLGRFYGLDDWDATETAVVPFRVKSGKLWRVSRHSFPLYDQISQNTVWTTKWTQHSLYWLPNTMQTS